MKLTENFPEVISNLVPYQKYTDIQDAAFSLVFFKTPEIVKQRPQRSSFLQKQALTTSLQNNCSKQQQTLSGKLTSVFEKDFTIAVLLHKKNFKRQKLRLRKAKKFPMLMPMPTLIPMLMPRCRCRDFQMVLLFLC